MKVYVVAISQKEANDLASQIGHATRAEANRHLQEVQQPPTDSFYANQYRVYAAELPGQEPR